MSHNPYWQVQDKGPLITEYFSFQLSPAHPYSTPARSCEIRLCLARAGGPGSPTFTLPTAILFLLLCLDSAMLSISSPVATKCTLETLLLFVGNPTFHLLRPGPQKKVFLIEGLGEEACPIIVCWHLGWVRKRDALCLFSMGRGQVLVVMGSWDALWAWLLPGPAGTADPCNKETRVLTCCSFGPWQMWDCHPRSLPIASKKKRECRPIGFILVPPLTSLMILGKLLIFSKLQFPYL